MASGKTNTIRTIVRQHSPLAAAMLLCLVHLASFDVRNQALITDVRDYVYFAWQVAEGAVPYRDFFDIKTPLATFSGALFYGLGQRLGADPLVAIRVGYLTITAIGGMFVFFIHRRLGGGAVAGVLGVLAYCSFGLLGLMASIGNTPKTLMALAASATALLVYQRRWFWAGVVGALAFMDWQVGALVWLAAFVPACVIGRPRWWSVLKTAGGGVAGLVPFLAYFAFNGALSQAKAQTLVASFLHGSGRLQSVGFGQRMANLSATVRVGCPEQGWLFYSSALGMAVAVWWLWRWRGREEVRLLLPLSIYHFGLVGFCLFDFQRYGDLFILLHSVAFFLAVAWIAVYQTVVQVGWGEGGLRRPATVGVAACVLALSLARPGPLRPCIDLMGTTATGSGLTLADQKELADAVGVYIDGKAVAFLEHSELLFLMRKTNVLPVIYWDRPAWSHFRNSTEETFLDTSVRLVRSVDPDVVVFSRLSRRVLLQLGLTSATYVSVSREDSRRPRQRFGKHQGKGEDAEHNYGVFLALR